MNTIAPRKLTLDDIADVRAYEREREAFKAKVIAMKQRRRLALGPFVSVVFENRDTIRHQIQEMARVERLATDEEIQTEIDIYNPMIPEPGQLCATLFIELTSDDQMREWLPKLVGIESSLVFRLPGGRTVRAVSEAQHASQLTRETITAAVHYVQFEFSTDEIDALASGDSVLACDHPAYLEEISLSEANREEFLTDLRP
ncbi:MAG: DUF3501 family protein [Acidimicrobiia bacterium]|jgi:Protein of unknown function (DUF3501)|nr:DUF3501 family protein [Actinomycetota bacterium]NDB05780.1 DUF3501 family protein [Acidimicrobiia bacterium]NDA77419.1 DUF3501 family protein [Actinomycetota bacterium]NDD97962.1 DUF3501 family protein [Actinomycetota bacterium]NDE59465.1 DUF3501 family protein [Acidimicrobiia bacterium]